MNDEETRREIAEWAAAHNDGDRGSLLTTQSGAVVEIEPAHADANEARTAALAEIDALRANLRSAS